MKSLKEFQPKPPRPFNVSLSDCFMFEITTHHHRDQDWVPESDDSIKDIDSLSDISTINEEKKFIVFEKNSVI